MQLSIGSIALNDKGYNTPLIADIHYTPNAATCLLTFNSFTTNIIEQGPNQIKEILKITDLLGRQTQPIKNTPLIYIYKNGTKEKRIILD